MKTTNYGNKLQAELDACGKMPILEIEVLTATGEKDWVMVDIDFRGRSCYGMRDSVSTKEKKSKFIARSKIPVDECFDLDEHLQELHTAVMDDICNGDLFTLPA